MYKRQLPNAVTGVRAVTAAIPAAAERAVKDVVGDESVSVCAKPVRGSPDDMAKARCAAAVSPGGGGTLRVACGDGGALPLAAIMETVAWDAAAWMVRPGTD